MKTDTRYEEWRSVWPDLRAHCERIDALLPAPRRARPRDPEEAEFLRSVGVPDDLIGPVVDRAQLRRIRTCLSKRLGDEQEAEQWLWYRPNPQTGGRPPVSLLVDARFDELLELASRA